MTPTDFNSMFYYEKLHLVEPHAPKVADFLTWYNPPRIITIYAIKNFFAELVFDLEKRKMVAINTIDTVDYLSKYRGFHGSFGWGATRSNK